MDRWACVDVPALPLQVLLRDHPSWQDDPVVVVEEDKPLAAIRWVNERARKSGILPGQRYAAALALERELRAGVVTHHAVSEAVEALVAWLQRFSPRVEPCVEQPGVLWLDASGLAGLYGTLERWAHRVHEALQEQRHVARVVVGFTRFGTYAAARTLRKPVFLFASEEHERRTIQPVPIARLDLDDKARDTLHKLGIRTLGEFLALDAGALLERFGQQARWLHELASGERQELLQPRAQPEPLARRIVLDDAELDANRLLFLVKRMLHPLLESLAARHQALIELQLRMGLERHAPYQAAIRPAAPCLDERQILDLVRLHLEGSPLGAGALEIELEAVGGEAETEQLRLFAEQTKRELAAADRALSRIRAELGPGAVCVAQLEQGHLPEASFSFQPLDHMTRPSPQAVPERVRVRRVFSKPSVIAEDPRLYAGALRGAFCITGGWWVREVRRHYYFLETEDGELCWCFYDAVRKRWMLQGFVQ